MKRKRKPLRDPALARARGVAEVLGMLADEDKRIALDLTASVLLSTWDRLFDIFDGGKG